MADEIKTNTVCCELFAKFAALFGWFFIGEEKHLTMPFVADDENDTKWRVNFCPACGAEIRGHIYKRGDIYF